MVNSSFRGKLAVYHHEMNSSGANLEPCGAGNGLRTQHTPTLWWFDLRPFPAEAAITSRSNKLSSVVELTASLERALPTWRIKLMSRQRVGPE